MAAVKQDGKAIDFASDYLKRNREILMTAIKQDGNALDFASEDLRGEKETVMAAVNLNWGHLS